MLQRLREFLVLVLLALLPFHAFLVTVLTKALVGPGHAPLTVLALWKEALLCFIVLLAFIECLHLWSRSRADREAILSTDALDLLILTTGLLAVLVSGFVRVPLGSFLMGVRYDLLAPVTFLVLRRVPWSALFLKHVRNLLLSVGTAVSFMALASLFLPFPFFTALGYSDLHSLYIPGSPIAAFQLIGESAIRRVQGPMSGPNQLGLWLLLPFALAVLEVMRWIQARVLHEHLWRSLLLSTLFAATIFFTFSRSAWIATTEILVVAVLLTLSTRQLRAVLTTGLAVGLLLFVGIASLAPTVLTRATSTRGHIERPLQAWQMMWERPWGHGLGTAGPASNRTSDTCVQLDKGADASWATSHPELCVFVSNVQVQPVDRECHCPVIPENWYLQFGIEMGVVGFVLSLLIPVITLMLLWERRQHDHGLRAIFGASLGAALLGLSLAGLLLHVWEDTATAFTIWILLAVSLPHLHHRTLREKLFGWMKFTRA